MQCIKYNKLSHFSCGNTKYSNDLKKTFVCVICAQKGSPKNYILTELKSKTYSPRQPNNNEKNHDQFKTNIIFPSENVLTKSPAAPGIAPRLLAAVENVTVERKDCPGSDLSYLIYDGTTKDSHSFDCQQCLHRIMRPLTLLMQTQFLLCRSPHNDSFFLLVKSA